MCTVIAALALGMLSSVSSTFAECLPEYLDLVCGARWPEPIVASPTAIDIGAIFRRSLWTFRLRAC